MSAKQPSVLHSRCFEDLGRRSDVFLSVSINHPSFTYTYMHLIVPKRESQAQQKRQNPSSYKMHRAPPALLVSSSPDLLSSPLNTTVVGTEEFILIQSSCDQLRAHHIKWETKHESCPPIVLMITTENVSQKRPLKKRNPGMAVLYSSSKTLATTRISSITSG